MSDPAEHHPVRSALWMLGAQACFAVMGAGARVGARHMPWQEVCASRFLIGALVAYGTARARGASLRVHRQREAWVRSFFGTLSAAGTFIVVSSPALAIGDGTTLFATSPLFVALLSPWLLGEAVPRQAVAALVLGFSGIYLVAQPSFATAAPLVVTGAATAVSSALAMIWLRRIGPNESSESIVFHFASVGFVSMALASVPVWVTPGPRDLAVLAITGVSAGLAQLMLTRAYALNRAASVAIVGYSGVVFARLLAVPVFGEIPTGMQVAGSAAVIASGVLLAMGSAAMTRLRREAGARPPTSR
jgi:drug/metabolite transporter (DMT)-like permease